VENYTKKIECRSCCQSVDFAECVKRQACPQCGSLGYLKPPKQTTVTATFAFDDTENKTPFEHVSLDFMADVANCFEAGIKDGRKAGDWKTLEWSHEVCAKYKAKIIRHLRGFEKEYEQGNANAATKHLAAIAANAQIINYHTK